MAVVAYQLGIGLGAIGAILISSNLLLIPLFVGCGLVFAGVTNSGAAGMLITKMPWNKWNQ
jgi:hypothetical protein